MNFAQILFIVFVFSSIFNELPISKDKGCKCELVCVCEREIERERDRERGRMEWNGRGVG